MKAANYTDFKQGLLTLIESPPPLSVYFFIARPGEAPSGSKSVLKLLLGRKAGPALRIVTCKDMISPPRVPCSKVVQTIQEFTLRRLVTQKWVAADLSIVRSLDQDRQSAMKILFRYSLFAVFAMVLNLVSQELSLLVYSGSLSLYVAIGVGTGVGLVSKYFLDKLYIFNLETEDWSDDLGRFVAYSVTGVFTTLVFWGFELSFELFFGTKPARYLGAVIGLTIGYLLKYQLDKRYVFPDRVV